MLDRLGSLKASIDSVAKELEHPDDLQRRLARHWIIEKYFTQIRAWKRDDGAAREVIERATTGED